MKTKSKFMLVALLTAGLFLTSCSGEGTQVEDENTTVEVEDTTTYRFNPANSKITFTAFKFLNKTGVNGSFNTANFYSVNEVGSLKEVMEGIRVEIAAKDLNTSDQGRDEKILKFFFGTLNIDIIQGKFIELNDDGTATIEISMNEISNNVTGKYELTDNNEFVFNAEINVNNWKGEKGIEALNEECHDLHIDHESGDTESKLWSDVNIGFIAHLDVVKG